MRFAVFVFPVFLLCHCAPVREEPEPAPRAIQARPVVVQAPEAAPESIRASNGTFSNITFEGVAFDSRSHRLVVADQEGGPGASFADAAAAGSSRNGLAAANAGFFTPEGAPLGLVISGGKRSGAWNSTSSLGSGVWHEDSAGRSSISRRARVDTAAMRELIQAGPMLVENGRTVSGLDPVKASVRTLILWDGRTRWWLGRASPCTLANLAAALSAGQPAGWKVRHALNLDGGRSSDLWISGAVEGGPVTRRAAWNRPVRNFLIVTRR